MTDLSKGIIEIDGVMLSRNTTAKDFANLNSPNVDVKVSKLGHTFVKFKTPVIAANIPMYVSAAYYTDSDFPEFELCPLIPDSIIDHGYGERTKYRLSLSKQWLKAMISEEPTTDCDEGISYHFNNFHISAFAREDIHYGLVGGEISISFAGEV